MSKQLSAVAQQYLAALRVQAMAEEAVAVAKDLMTQAFTAEGVSEATYGSQKVLLVEAVRRNFDVATLEGLVNAKVFRAVTKTAVEPKAFDKARKAGEIAEAIETACVKGTPYTRIVVSDIAEAVLSAEAV